MPTIPNIWLIMKMIIRILFLLVSGLAFAIQTDASTSGQKLCKHQICAGQHLQDKRPKPNDMNPEKFRKELKKFISREAGFTPKEAQAFFPLFFEMKEKLRDMEHKKMNAINRAAKNNMSEKDCSRILREMNEMDKKVMRTEHEYLARMQKAVGSQKLVKAVSADRKFGRRMFRKMANKTHK